MAVTSLSAFLVCFFALDDSTRRPIRLDVNLTRMIRIMLVTRDAQHQILERHDGGSFKLF